MPKDRLLYRGALGWLGVYRSSADDPGDDHAFSCPLVVFPRTTLVVQLEMVGCEEVIDPTTALLYEAGEIARVRWIDKVDRCDYLALRRDLYEAATGRDFERPGFSRTVVPLGVGASLAVRTLVAELARGDPVEQLRIEETMLGIVAGLAAAASPGPDGGHHRHRTTTEHGRLADRVRELVAADPAADLGLDEIARQVGASSAHLSRVFRRHTGITIHAYRTAVRLLRCLDEVDEDWSVVAARHGFSSHSHFGAVMRDHLGVRPSDVRHLLAGQPSMSIDPWWLATCTSV
jgi:AraC-like DNA-binding protein